MIIPYSSPNLRFGDFFKALFISRKKAENKLKSYFSFATGKKYVLITNSCRTALYIAYQALNIKGEVITSPLTCKVAIDPIVESGNMPVYADINKLNLNVDPQEIEKQITDKTIAIQAIHLGGVVCDMDSIIDIAKKKQLYIIEDCAQSLCATFNSRNSGSFGHISCFSLIKNAYGIGGGIFATDSEEIFHNAQTFSNSFPKSSKKLVLYRIFRNLIDTKRRLIFFRFLYRLLIYFKRDRKNYKSVYDQLKTISNLELKIAAHQINRYGKLHSKRKEVGRMMLQMLEKYGLIENNGFNKFESSFTKLFIFNSKIKSEENIRKLTSKGVESMHLEYSAGKTYQEKLVKDNQDSRSVLKNYFLVHDSLISLPLFEDMKVNDIEKMVHCLNDVINEA